MMENLFSLMNSSLQTLQSEYNHQDDIVSLKKNLLTKLKIAFFLFNKIMYMPKWFLARKLFR